MQADVPAHGRMVEFDAAVPVLGPPGRFGGIVKGLHAHAFRQDALRIHVGDAQLGLQIEALALGQQIAQLVDHALPVPRQVGGAFAVPARRIGIGA